MTFDEAYRTYKELKRQEFNLQLKKQELQESCGYPQGRDYSDTPVSHSVSTPAALVYVMRLEEIEKKEKELDATMECVRNDIQRFLDKIDNDDIRRICSIKLFTKTSWKRIAADLDKSYSHVRSLFYQGMTLLHTMEEI